MPSKVSSGKFLLLGTNMASSFPSWEMSAVASLCSLQNGITTFVVGSEMLGIVAPLMSHRCTLCVRFTIPLFDTVGSALPGNKVKDGKSGE